MDRRVEGALAPGLIALGICILDASGGRFVLIIDFPSWFSAQFGVLPAAHHRHFSTFLSLSLLFFFFFFFFISRFCVMDVAPGTMTSRMGGTCDGSYTINEAILWGWGEASLAFVITAFGAQMGKHLARRTNRWFCRKFLVRSTP
jgi:hypothetical protein